MCNRIESSIIRIESGNLFFHLFHLFLCLLVGLSAGLQKTAKAIQIKRQIQELLLILTIVK